jgi:hypothetical protein
MLHEKMDAGHVEARRMDYILELAWQNPDRKFWELAKNGHSSVRVF